MRNSKQKQDEWINVMLFPNLTSAHLFTIISTTLFQGIELVAGTRITRLMGRSPFHFKSHLLTKRMGKVLDNSWGWWQHGHEFKVNLPLSSHCSPWFHSQGLLRKSCKDPRESVWFKIYITHGPEANFLRSAPFSRQAHIDIL